MQPPKSAPTESIPLCDSALLFAVADGRSWLMEVTTASLSGLPVSPIAARRGSTAASFIEGAIAAGFAPHRPPASEPSYSLPRYIRWLAGNYVFAGSTPGLFRRGAERFDLCGRADFAEFARQKADEEQGHAALAFRDLEALGLPAADVIALIEPPSATAFVERFRSYVEGVDPVALFGFSYCLERMASSRDAAFIRSVEAVCPPQVRACRFLKVHSGIGADRAHVDEQLAFFESLTAAELVHVVRAAYETAAMLTEQAALDRALADDEIERRFADKGVRCPGSSRAQGPKPAAPAGIQPN